MFRGERVCLRGRYTRSLFSGQTFKFRQVTNRPGIIFQFTHCCVAARNYFPGALAAEAARILVV